MQEAATISIEPRITEPLSKTTWEDLNEPGSYVDPETGELYRIPAEALISGASVIRKESFADSALLQISRNPFITTQEARIRCAQHNIAPNF